MKIKTITSYLLTALFCISAYQTAAAEQTSVILTRTATSGPKLEAQLSQDIYRSIPYQDTYEEQEAYQAQEEYTVDIPYEETETYYVDIPYQETESYLDTETYYENEYRCHNETEYVQECSTERMCSREPGDNVCQEVEECGTNVHGERICKTRKVCNRGPDRENCQDKNVCRSVPRTREKCGYEQVAKTRTVTKYRTVTRYRQEARTRTVTKYRQETRTRTVTRYRTVTKCCVTRYREEFDHTWKMDVQVLLPAQAALQAGEVEKFELNLKGSEANPDVTLNVMSSIYGYKLGRKDIKASSGLIELLLTPKYNQQTLGEKLIERVELTGANEDSLSELLITDKGIVPRVLTQYRYRILDLQTKQAVAEGEVTSELAVRSVVSIKLAQALPGDVDYVVQISATRSGIVLEKGFSFSITKEVQFTRWDSANFNEKTLKNLSVQELKDKTTLAFTDEGAHVKLATQYKVMVLNAAGTELSSQVLNATDVLDANKKASIALDEKVMALEEDLSVKLLVQRTGKRLEKPVQFQLQTERVFLRLEDLKDKKKISGLGISGQGSNARLVFQDLIKDSSKIKTEYKLTITRQGGFLNLQKKTMANLTLSQAEMQGANFSQLLSKLGISTSALNEHLTSGSTIWLDLVANRKNVTDKKTLGTVKKSVELKIQ